MYINYIGHCSQGLGFNNNNYVEILCRIHESSGH